MKQTQDKWERMDFWFSCYVWEDYVNGVAYVITKLPGDSWRAGKYTDDNVDYQPNPSRGGYLRSFETLKSAKDIIEKRAGGE